jgi:CRISPR system Cascade subunit CasA
MTVAEKEFNLLDEPWILALNESGESEELGLLEVLQQAHRLKGLAGELPTQDVAVLRLLLAVLYATFTRTEEKGQRAPLKTAEEALRRWEALWKLGRFQMEPVQRRLELYRERFFLFHPEWPFYQVAGLHAVTGKINPVSQLIMDVPSRENRQFFTNRHGTASHTLSFAEAARWLVCLQSWDYAGKKASVVGGSPNGGGTGWLGKLGIVYPEGKTLFETLLLNFVLVSDDALLPIGVPIWEENTPPTAEKLTRLPNGYCELMTWQSRRALIFRENGKVSGVIYSYGDIFEKENTFIEQMSGWHLSSEKTATPKFLPNTHKVSRSLWRDLGAILPLRMEGEQQSVIPGVIRWLTKLHSDDVGQINIHAVGVQFGTMQAVVDELIDDRLSINSAIFSENSQTWVSRIVDILAMTDECVKRLGYLASDIATAAGDKEGNGGKKNSAVEEAYFRLDMPFRSWISGIDPQSDDMSAKTNEWKDRLKAVLMALGEELIRESGDKAFVGTVVKRHNREELINAPKAFIKFKSGINHLLTR